MEGAVTGACIRLAGLPVPPSSNNQYLTIRRGGSIRHVASRELIQFKKAMKDYNLRSWTQNGERRAQIKKWLEMGCVLEITTTHFFHYSSLFTKRGTPKRMDVSNRIKAIHDELAEMLGFDDSLFFRVTALKAVCLDSCLESVCADLFPLDNPLES